MKIKNNTEKDFVGKKYEEYMKEHNGKIPDMFNPYNKQKITDIAPTQTTHSGSTTSSATILIREATKRGYKEAESGDGINICGRMEYQRGNVQKGLSLTLNTKGTDNGVAVDENRERERSKHSNNESANLRIRKLTPKECIKLMGFESKDYQALAEFQSDSAVYHEAGDSIVVPTLACLIGSMLCDDYREKVKGYIENVVSEKCD